MDVSAIRRIEFDAGHRVFGHESKCATLHGHRYVVEVHCQAPALDSIGRVIDFGVIKEKIGWWIDKYWDHAMLLWEWDTDLSRLQDCIGFKPIYVCKFNPTAENMAVYLLNEICPKLLDGTGIDVVKIVMWETPNCKVEVTL